jgi:hypothetical protein
MLNLKNFIHIGNFLKTFLHQILKQNFYFINVEVNFMATPSQATGVLDVKVAKQAPSGLQEGSGLTSSSGEKQHIENQCCGSASP